MKRFSASSFLAGLLFAVLLMAPAGVTAKATPATYYGLPTVNLVINGVPADSDAPPVLVGGRVYGPIRVIAESLGGRVDWSQESRTVSVDKAATVAPAAATTGTVPVVGSPESEGTPARIALEVALTAAVEIRDAALAVINAERDAALAALLVQYATTPMCTEYQQAVRAVVAAWNEAAAPIGRAYEAAVAAANAAYETP